jgi:hypothetical protein
MSQLNSPYYRSGAADGQADMARLGSCPPAGPAGMDPDKSWSIMYRRGYLSEFDETIPPHSCKKCEQS